MGVQRGLIRVVVPPARLPAIAPRADQHELVESLECRVFLGVIGSLYGVALGLAECVERGDVTVGLLTEFFDAHARVVPAPLGAGAVDVLGGLILVEMREGAQIVFAVKLVVVQQLRWHRDAVLLENLRDSFGWHAWPLRVGEA